MYRNSHLTMNSRSSQEYSLRLRGLRTTLAGQLERNRRSRSRSRSYGYACADLVQSDLTRIRPQFRTLVQLRG